MNVSAPLPAAADVVDIAIDVEECPLLEADIYATISSALSELRLRNLIDSQPVECTVLVVDAEHMRQLNRDYRGKDKLTNVLSFPVEIEFEVMQELPNRLVGDIVICHAVVAAEALAQGKSDVAHYQHLCVHGLLHLLGYDHIREAEADIMESLEIDLLAKQQVDNPYQ